MNLITIKEASDLYKIGRSNLYKICNIYGKTNDFVLKIGQSENNSKILIKKEKFENFLDDRYTVFVS